MPTSVGAADAEPVRQEAQRPDLVGGLDLTVEGIGAAIGHLLPENAIVSRRGDHLRARPASLHPGLVRRTTGCYGTGGSIGRGLPGGDRGGDRLPGPQGALARRATAAPCTRSRALWTQAREQCDVTTMIYANRSYAILHGELRNVGANPGPQGARHVRSGPARTSTGSPWPAGMGVDAVRAETADQFNRALGAALSSKGPHLIEAVI